MKYILLIAAFFCSSVAFGQGAWNPAATYNIWKGTKSDSIAIVPRDTIARNTALLPSTGQPVGDYGRIQAKHGLFYFHDSIRNRRMAFYDDLPSDYVTLSTNQSITGQKTFLDTTKVEGQILTTKRIRIGDSLDVFDAPPLNDPILPYNTQAFQLYGNAEFYSDFNSATGRDLDFFKMRGSNLPDPGDEYGYLNWRTRTADGRSRPAIQLIGLVGDSVNNTWSSGKLVMRMPGFYLDYSDTWVLDQYKRNYINGYLRVNAEAQPLGFENQRIGSDGNIWLYGLNTSRSLDILRETTGGIAPGDEYGHINFFGKKPNNTYGRTASIIGRANSSASAANPYGDISFLIRTPVDSNYEVVVMRSPGWVGINKTAPEQALDVIGNVKATGFLEVGSGQYVGFGGVREYFTGVAGGAVDIGTDDASRIRIAQDGKIGINTTNPLSTLDINGANGYSQFRLRSQYTPTSSADSNGSAGDIAIDDNYIYFKTSTGWKRSALTTF